MALSRADLYNVHSRNLAAVDRGLNRIRRTANRAVAQGQDAIADDLTKVYALLLATKLEARLRKVLYEAPAFDGATRSTILAQGAQDKQWLRVIDEAFKRRYSVGRLTRRTLPTTAWLRRQVLREAVSDDLAPVIQLRNKLAHGQWITALNKTGTNHSPALDAVLRNLNLLALKDQERLIDKVAEAVSDLAVSRRTFERDFDSHFRAVEDARARLQEGGYEDWVRHQRRSFKLARDERGVRRNA
jgi:hypothetical protein